MFVKRLNSATQCLFNVKTVKKSCSTGRAPRGDIIFGLVTYGKSILLRANMISQGGQGGEGGEGGEPGAQAQRRRQAWPQVSEGRVHAQADARTRHVAPSISGHRGVLGS